MNLDELFDRRLLIVVGKGGVGKTTLGCALALEAARRGKRTLLCEVDGAARAAHLLQANAGPLGTAVPSAAGPSVMAIEGSAALAEYLAMIIPVQRLLRVLLDSPIYQHFVAAAPGLKELMTIGKIWYEAEGRPGDDGARPWDCVVVDAPATGHGLQYLRMPAAARDAFRMGLVHREAQRLLDLLTDPARTAINLVTTAEEMAVNETIAMYRALRDDLGMPMGFLFVNRLHQGDVSAGDAAQLERAVAGKRDGKMQKLLATVAARAREDVGWSALNAAHRARLAAAIELPAVELPFVFSESFGFAEVQALADHLARPVRRRARQA
ncbi:MAG: ArsA family ATPase [Candidatus Binatia bacterium]